MRGANWMTWKFSAESWSASRPSAPITPNAWQDIAKHKVEVESRLKLCASAGRRNSNWFPRSGISMPRSRARRERACCRTGPVHASAPAPAPKPAAERCCCLRPRCNACPGRDPGALRAELAKLEAELAALAR